MASEDVLAQAERDAETAEELFWTGGARRIRALAAEVRELRRDKARLDWLTKQGDPSWALFLSASWQSEPELREAIDAAMGATENG